MLWPLDSLEVRLRERYPGFTSTRKRMSMVSSWMAKKFSQYLTERVISAVCFQNDHFVTVVKSGMMTHYLIVKGCLECSRLAASFTARRSRRRLLPGPHVTIFRVNMLVTRPFEEIGRNHLLAGESVDYVKQVVVWP